MIAHRRAEWGRPGSRPTISLARPHGLAVRTPAFHAGDHRFESGWGYCGNRLRAGDFQSSGRAGRGPLVAESGPNVTVAGMIDIFNGKRLQELELVDVRSLLDDAQAEPLHWEAKGIEVKPGEVRKQICGFANSHDGGYLILGTDVRNDEWVFDGVAFPDNDPPAWVSSVAEGVQPYSEGLDTRPILLDGRRMLAVVWVPPTPTPPCNAHGTVYERVSGRTVSVREPLRLAQLFARGDGAHARAQELARRAAADALELGAAESPPSDDLQFGLGLCATSYAPNISSRLFSPGFWDTVAAASPLPQPGPLRPQGVRCEHRQDAVIGRVPRHWEGDPRWYMRATWNGSVAVACLFSERSGISGLIESIHDGWAAACTLIAELQPIGDAYLSVQFQGDPPFGKERVTEQSARLKSGGSTVDRSEGRSMQTCCSESSESLARRRLRRVRSVGGRLTANVARS